MFLLQYRNVDVSSSHFGVFKLLLSQCSSCTDQHFFLPAPPPPLPPPPPPPHLLQDFLQLVSIYPGFLRHSPILAQLAQFVFLSLQLEPNQTKIQQSLMAEKGEP